MSDLPKLVRDRVPAAIRRNGGECVSHECSDQRARAKFLDAKLLEEALELVEAPTHEAVLEELTDVLTVLSAFAEFHGIGPSGVFEASRKKYRRFGGFDDWVILESVS